MACSCALIYEHVAHSTQIFLHLELNRHSRGIKVVWSNTQIDQDLLAVDELLDNETHGGYHRQTSIVKFLRLHVRKSHGIIGFQAERIKALVF